MDFDGEKLFEPLVSSFQALIARYCKHWATFCSRDGMASHPRWTRNQCFLLNPWRLMQPFPPLSWTHYNMHHCERPQGKNTALSVLMIRALIMNVIFRRERLNLGASHSHAHHPRISMAVARQENKMVALLVASLSEMVSKDNSRSAIYGYIMLYIIIYTVYTYISTLLGCKWRKSFWGLTKTSQWIPPTRPIQPTQTNP